MRLNRGTVRLLLVIAVLLMAKVSFGQKIETMNLKAFLSHIEASADGTHVFNFWATWCVPCLTEIPILEKLNQDREDILVTLVSMDMDTDPNPDKIHRFIDRKNIQSDVIILDESNSSKWIAKIDKTWRGTLPATLVVNNRTGKRTFLERQLTEGELENIVEGLR